MVKQDYIVNEMNRLGKMGEPFLFLIDFAGTNPLLFKGIGDTTQIIWEIPGKSNYNQEANKTYPSQWNLNPVSFEKYEAGFEKITNHINNGDTYLLNYTQPTGIETDLSLEQIFHLSNARYKVLLKDRFVCFSPESFVKIEDGKISSFPMKGTMDASIKNSKELILKDSKEVAEHHTIVDLIRNDLSLVAENVTVEKFRYLERIKTNRRDLWQVSSKITGTLPKNYKENIGTIIHKMLPAGSISGAPKKKTIEIIGETEKYDRGYYTGVFGYFDGTSLDSCVLIRYIENQQGNLVYKSGGGITFMSDAKKEYDEMLKKVYVPFG